MVSIGRLHSPCSSGWLLVEVVFILSASLTDMSQQEPLLVSWSLSAWSLSPCPLSLRLALSGSLNVELLKYIQRKRRESVVSTSWNWSVVSCKAIWHECKWGSWESYLIGLTFEQTAACCPCNWALRENCLSVKEKEKNTYSCTLDKSPAEQQDFLVEKWLIIQKFPLIFRFVHFN